MDGVLRRLVMQLLKTLKVAFLLFSIHGTSFGEISYSL